MNGMSYNHTHDYFQHRYDAPFLHQLGEWIKLLTRHPHNPTRMQLHAQLETQTFLYGIVKNLHVNDLDLMLLLPDGNLTSLSMFLPMIFHVVVKEQDNHNHRSTD